MSFVKWRNTEVFIQSSKFNSEGIDEIKEAKILFDNAKVRILTTVSYIFLNQ